MFREHAPCLRDAPHRIIPAFSLLFIRQDGRLKGESQEAIPSLLILFQSTFRQTEISVCRLWMHIRNLWMAIQRLCTAVQSLRTEISPCLLKSLIMVLV